MMQQVLIYLLVVYGTVTVVHSQTPNGLENLAEAVKHIYHAANGCDYYPESDVPCDDKTNTKVLNLVPGSPGNCSPTITKTCSSGIETLDKQSETQVVSNPGLDIEKVVSLYRNLILGNHSVSGTKSSLGAARKESGVLGNLNAQSNLMKTTRTFHDKKPGFNVRSQLMKRFRNLMIPFGRDDAGTTSTVSQDVNTTDDASKAHAAVNKGVHVDEKSDVAGASSPVSNAPESNTSSERSDDIPSLDTSNAAGFIRIDGTLRNVKANYRRPSNRQYILHSSGSDESSVTIDSSERDGDFSDSDEVTSRTTRTGTSKNVDHISEEETVKNNNENTIDILGNQNHITIIKENTNKTSAKENISNGRSMLAQIVRRNNDSRSNIGHRTRNSRNGRRNNNNLTERRGSDARPRNRNRGTSANNGRRPQTRTSDARPRNRNRGTSANNGRRPQTRTSDARPRNINIGRSANNDRRRNGVQTRNRLPNPNSSKISRNSANIDGNIGREGSRGQNQQTIRQQRPTSGHNTGPLVRNKRQIPSTHEAASKLSKNSGISSEVGNRHSPSTSRNTHNRMMDNFFQLLKRWRSSTSEIPTRDSNRVFGRSGSSSSKRAPMDRGTYRPEKATARDNSRGLERRGSQVHIDPRISRQESVSIPHTLDANSPSKKTRGSKRAPMDRGTYRPTQATTMDNNRGFEMHGSHWLGNIPGWLRRAPMDQGTKIPEITSSRQMQDTAGNNFQRNVSETTHQFLDWFPIVHGQELAANTQHELQEQTVSDQHQGESTFNEGLKQSLHNGQSNLNQNTDDALQGVNDPGLDEQDTMSESQDLGQGNLNQNADDALQGVNDKGLDEQETMSESQEIGQGNLNKDIEESLQGDYNDPGVDEQDTMSGSQNLGLGNTPWFGAQNITSGSQDPGQGNTPWFDAEDRHFRM